MPITKKLMLVAAAAVAAVLVVLAAGCGVAPYSGGTTPDVPAAVQKARAAVLQSGTVKNPYPGGTSATWYEVGRPGSNEVKAVVSVLRFESARARDAAYRDISNRQSTGSRQTLVYTVGDSVVVIGHIRDRGTAQRLDRLFSRMGAR